MDTVRLPKYRRHKSSGLAVVTLGDRQIYLGRYGTAASRQAYRRAVAEFMAAGGRDPRPARPAPDFTVVELIAAYWQHAQAYYVQDGKPSGELQNIKTAMRHLKALYGDTPAADFGPLAFKAVRATMVATNLSRGTVNRYANIIRRAFKWAAAAELVPPAALHGLQAVEGLRRGRSEARETEPVRPVAEAYVRKVLPFLPPAVAAMVDLQVLTGMRSGEVVLMRGRDLNTAGPAVWQYRPARHKTAHHGHERVIDLGPRAQAILRPWLKTDLEAYLFSPRETEAARNGARRETRRTALTSSARARRLLSDRGLRADRRRRRRPPAERYTSSSYRRAIARGIERANAEIAADLAARGVTDAEKMDAAKIPAWHPHQIRHTFATEIRRRYGVEAARVLLGHHSIGVTECYAERDLQVAARVAAEVG